MYVIKDNFGKYLVKIDHTGASFSRSLEKAIASRNRNDLVHIFDFLCGYLCSFQSVNIVKLSKSEEIDFLLGLE